MSRQGVLLTVAMTVVVLIVAGAAQERPSPPQPSSQPAAASQPAATTQPAASQPSGRGRRPPRDIVVRDEDVLAVLKSRLPMRHERLQQIKQDDPNRYAFFLEMTKDWYKEWRKLPPPLQDDDIEGQLLRVKIWQMVEDLRRQSSDKPRDVQEAELAQAVTRQYDIEYALLEYKLKTLEDDLAQVRAQLDDRIKNRDAFIKGRLDRLLRATTQPAHRERRGSGREGGPGGGPEPRHGPDGGPGPGGQPKPGGGDGPPPGGA